MNYQQQLHIEFKLIPTYCFCNVAIAPIRNEPTHTAEQVTQLLFGEKAKVLELNNKDWAYVRCGWDGYEGWCKVAQLTEITLQEFEKPSKFLSHTHYGRLQTSDGGTMLLAAGSELDKTKITRKDIFEAKFKGKKWPVASLDTANLQVMAMQYLHAPYLWGGRTAMGIDCSGLTQMVYKLCGVPLRRDASQQVQEGVLVDFLEQARCGDLAFFHNEEDKITHVGMLLDNQTIIHATEVAGRVVIDRIDAGGIISVLLKKRTHSLRVIKRMVK